MSNNKYWQSFGELNNSEAYQKAAKDEFREELPFEAEDGKSFLEATAPRRDFLKYLGFDFIDDLIQFKCFLSVHSFLQDFKVSQFLTLISNFHFRVQFMMELNSFFTYFIE